MRRRLLRTLVAPRVLSASLRSSSSFRTSSALWRRRVGILCQAALDHAGQISGYLRARLLSDWRRVSLMMEESTSAGVSPPNGRSPGQHLVKNDTQRENVRARVHCRPLRLLRRHVVQRSDNHALRRLRCCGEHSLSASPPTNPLVGFASPKSSTLMRPSSPTIMLSGLRSRCVMPS